MADLKILGQTTSKSRSGNAQMVSVTGTRDGALYTAQYELAGALEGRIFEVQLGTLTTPITFRVGIDADQPEVVIDVPSGTTIIPVRILCHLEDAAGTDTEFVVQTTDTLVGAGTSTTGTVLNARTNNPLASNCTFRYTYSGNGTVPTNVREFFRSGYAFADATTNPRPSFEWSFQNGTPQVIVGPGALVLYCGATGTAPAGYLKASWMEFPSTDL